jgi:hypothetical protein
MCSTEAPSRSLEDVEIVDLGRERGGGGGRTVIAGTKDAREKYLASVACTSMYNTVNLEDTARQPIIHDGSGTAIR